MTKNVTVLPIQTMYLVCSYHCNKKKYYTEDEIRAAIEAVHPDMYFENAKKPTATPSANIANKIIFSKTASPFNHKHLCDKSYLSCSKLFLL